ncbi:MAG TPA: 50S ribosome-binding GTPase, partial [Fibrobacteria bacterium]|nr:50S ribosome-binding GTPase [Fibrobacteria bacterium]
MKKNPDFVHPMVQLGQKAEFRLGAVAPDQFVGGDLPQIAFAGRSNVGKSSLQNALLGRQGLVRTSRTPGRTREINFFEVPDHFWFVDLPGFGYARGGSQASGRSSPLLFISRTSARSLREAAAMIESSSTMTAWSTM